MKPFIKGTKTNSNVEHITLNEAHPQHKDYQEIVIFAHNKCSILPEDTIFRMCLELYNYVENVEITNDEDNDDTILFESISNYNECMSYYQIWQLASFYRDDIIDAAENQGIRIELDLKKSNLSAFLQSNLFWWQLEISRRMFTLIKSHRATTQLEALNDLEDEDSAQI